MFKFIFYFFGIAALLYEYWSIANFDKLDRFRGKIKESKKNGGKVNLSGPEITFAFLQLLYFAWVLVGLFSSQWVIFLLIFCLSFVNSWFRGSRIWNSVDSILTIILILFAILNTYHLQIDLFSEILDLFLDKKGK